MTTRKLLGRILLAIVLLFGLWVGGYHAYRALSFEVAKHQARTGNANAQYRLGLRYLDRGSRRDVEQAMAWFNAAARNDHPKASEGLGRAYSAMGEVVYKNSTGEKDDKEAVRWFRRAAALGNSNGLFHLGAMYEKGRGVQKDLTQVVSLLRQSACRRNGGALFTLYHYQRRGRGGLAKDPVLALKWLYLAVHYGDATSDSKKLFAVNLKPHKSTLTKQQIATAIKAAEAWRKQYLTPDAHANRQ